MWRTNLRHDPFQICVTFHVFSKNTITYFTSSKGQFNVKLNVTSKPEIRASDSQKRFTFQLEWIIRHKIYDVKLCLTFALSWMIVTYKGVHSLLTRKTHPEKMPCCSFIFVFGVVPHKGGISVSVSTKFPSCLVPMMTKITVPWMIMTRTTRGRSALRRRMRNVQR